MLSCQYLLDHRKMYIKGAPSFKRYSQHGFYGSRKQKRSAFQIRPLSQVVIVDCFSMAGLSVSETLKDTCIYKHHQFFTIKPLNV